MLSISKRKCSLILCPFSSIYSVECLIHAHAVIALKCNLNLRNIPSIVSIRLLRAEVAHRYGGAAHLYAVYPALHISKQVIGTHRKFMISLGQEEPAVVCNPFSAIVTVLYPVHSTSVIHGGEKYCG